MERRELRSGYTTGTCAAAAAKAAAAFLLTGRCPESVDVALPCGKTVEMRVSAGGSAGQPERSANQAGGSAGQPEKSAERGKVPDAGRTARVQKDAGDDPDVTHGTWICGSVSKISQDCLEEWKKSGAGYWLEEYPGLYLTGGAGIGMVTKPGLSCPVGHYAINPVPRKMILSAVEEACRKAAYEGCLCVRISIPEGERLAAKTFNPRLGIEGGISVLGTTGMVKPMSEEALTATIQLDIHMKAVSGQRTLLMAPGNYGEAFLQEQMGVTLGSAVLCSNFVREAAMMAAEEEIPNLLFVSHMGKLVKVSAGMENTHSRYGDGRMDQM
ncbi:MAG: cobalt-precorrin-5B (C(1))-methyltransferase CbiD [Eubacteriales bacterium]|nr:cobalt-precorrin-5B (C(1))-methyltransferase CbiD [Eubacteriales bacterium]